ncbi:hypothetical protein [Roseateles chitinivorans]|uniref:hypothetical protein n=1 Tax=Roseateles chitinivorans TaxID=2917965 RepID=UPI003D675943
MDKDWSADVDAEPVENGRFVAVLVLEPPAEVGPPIRLRLQGEYDHPELARMAALDAFTEMSLHPDRRTGPWGRD